MNADLRGRRLNALRWLHNVVVKNLPRYDYVVTLILMGAMDK